MARQASERIGWIDAARGLGIVLVLLGHVEGGLIDAGVQSQSSWSWPGYAIYTFHMPLFFVLAGLNVPRSLDRGPRHFLRTKLQTIAFPYVLWSLIQGAALVAASSFTNGQTHLRDLLSIGWHPLGQFWFLYVLMICQLAALVIGPLRTVSAGLAIISLGAGALLAQGGLIEALLHSFPFFVAGILLSRRLASELDNDKSSSSLRAKRSNPGATSTLDAPGLLRQRARNDEVGNRSRSVGLGRAAHGTPGRYLIYAAAAFIGLVSAALLSGPLDGMNSDSPLALPAAICGIAFIVSLARALGGSMLSAASSLGRMSMTIYVMHVLAAAGTRILLLKLHVPPNPALYVVACTTVGIAAPMIAHRVLGSLGLLASFGLANRTSKGVHV